MRPGTPLQTGRNQRASSLPEQFFAAAIPARFVLVESAKIRGAGPDRHCRETLSGFFPTVREPRDIFFRSPTASVRSIPAAGARGWLVFFFSPARPEFAA